MHNIARESKLCNPIMHICTMLPSTARRNKPDTRQHQHICTMLPSIARGSKPSTRTLRYDQTSFGGTSHAHEADDSTAQLCPTSLGRAMQTHEHCDSNAHTRTANATTGVTPPSSFFTNWSGGSQNSCHVHVTRSKRLDQHLDGGCQVARQSLM